MKNGFRFDIIANFIKNNHFTKRKFCKCCDVSILEFKKMQEGDNSFCFESLCKIATFMNIDLMNFFFPFPVPDDYE